MKVLFEWARRQVWWRLPGERTVWDDMFRGHARVDVLSHERPRLRTGLLDNWTLQSLAMCPAGGRLVVRQEPSAVVLTVLHPKYLEQNSRNRVEIRVDGNGDPFLYFELILFDAQAYPGFGAVAFYRAAQAAQRVGLTRIELLAAGGKGYKYSWTRPFNGYHSWARFGFDAPLWPTTLQKCAQVPHLANCRTLLDIIAVDPGWWKDNGDGCDMVFDLRQGSRSWHTLLTYLKERGLK